MTGSPNRTAKSPAKAFVLGRASFARISAVEGIHLSPDMEARFLEFDRSEAPAKERRAAISRQFKK